LGRGGLRPLRDDKPAYRLTETLLSCIRKARIT